MYLLLFCSDLSEDHGNHEIEASAHDEDEKESRSSAASESDEEPSMRPADHVDHPPLSLMMPQGRLAEKKALLLQFLDFYSNPTFEQYQEFSRITREPLLVC